jgi:glycerol-3-phosphate O-acyltransferase
VTLALLGAGEQACSVAEVAQRLKSLLMDVERRGLPTAGPLDLDTPAGIERALDALVANDVVTRFAEGSECVYLIGPDQQLAAAYYRNTIIHFFVNPAIVELALLQAAEESESEDRVAAFWRAAMQLRDLLKFEFFFAEKEIFRGELRRELASRDGDWEATLRDGPEAIQALVRSFRPFNAHRVLRPFLEAYRIVADQLERIDPSQPVDESRLLSDCTGLGKQYHLQRRIRGAASISQVLFETALRLADNRGLLRSTEPDLAAWRRAFAEEIRVAIRHTDAIDLLAASRRAGLIP